MTDSLSMLVRLDDREQHSCIRQGKVEEGESPGNSRGIMIRTDLRCAPSQEVIQPDPADSCASLILNLAWEHALPPR